MVQREKLLAKIESARTDVARAESELERVMSALESAPRSQKTTMSEGLGIAFAILRSAKNDLADLEALIVADDDPV